MGRCCSVVVDEGADLAQTGTTAAADPPTAPRSEMLGPHAEDVPLGSVAVHEQAGAAGVPQGLESRLVHGAGDSGHGPGQHDVEVQIPSGGQERRYRSEDPLPAGGEDLIIVEHQDDPRTLDRVPGREGLGAGLQLCGDGGGESRGGGRGGGVSTEVLLRASANGVTAHVVDGDDELLRRMTLNEGLDDAP